MSWVFSAELEGSSAHTIAVTVFAGTLYLDGIAVGGQETAPPPSSATTTPLTSSQTPPLPPIISSLTTSSFVTASPTVSSTHTSSPFLAAGGKPTRSGSRGTASGSGDNTPSSQATPLASNSGDDPPDTVAFSSSEKGSETPPASTPIVSPAGSLGTHTGTSTPVIAGIVVACLLFILVLLGCVLYLRRKQRNLRKSMLTRFDSPTPYPSPTTHIVDHNTPIEKVDDSTAFGYGDEKEDTKKPGDRFSYPSTVTTLPRYRFSSDGDTFNARNMNDA
ncbi:uncharacterized protein BXZ73DRAFT_76972 [Epithele typhae]|uniref:uncharacterized protein n=1 Tax=Epithele typhae TaxID=378194 RepID=UPI00200725B3|nr:uncharacterized protein BXZ73DRAFT_76972 [Epithele typhae]KAH9934485.1 hypothetical protein BXZ73DRAFT_76972 [Epithele typhae]